jgi:triosephosphate isomerase
MTHFQPKKYLVGNWKMNQTLNQVGDFFDFYKLNFPPQNHFERAEMWVAPQMIHWGFIQDILSQFHPDQSQPFKIKLGAQNSGPDKAGAYTGEISPFAIKEMGGHFVILGHSERRAHFWETHSLLHKKASWAMKEAGLKVIFCVGETLEQREKKLAFEVVKEQISEGLGSLVGDKNLLIAYEPVWAIGTGKVASPQEAQEMHQFIRNLVGDTPILYGGSVSPQNIKSLMEQKDIDGALVGGASLKGSDFLKMFQEINS